MKANNQIFSTDLKAFFRLREPKGTNPTLVYMCLTINNRTYKIATGVRVHPQQWHTPKQLAYTSSILSPLDNRNNEIANKRINECRLVFEDFKNYLCDHPSALYNVDLSYLKDNLYHKNTLTMGKKKYANPILFLEQIIDKQGWEEGSKKFYLQAITYIKKYTTEKNISIKDINEIDYDFLLQLREWLKEQTSQRNKKDNDKLSIKTVNKVISNIKQILKSIEDDSIYNITKSQIYKIKSLKQADTSNNEISLTEDEIERIYNLELEEREAKIRDTFIFQCFTGQRFNSIKKFASSFTEVTTKDGKCWEVIQNKGKKVVKVPISNLSKAILDRNNGSIKYGHNSITNNTLREIARKAGITEESTYTKQTGNGIIQHKRKRYELITTHTARRSFVTISKQNDIDDRQVMSVTGHTTRTMLDLYNKVDSSKSAIKVADKLNDIFDTGKEKKKEEKKASDSNKDIDEAKKILAYLGADAITTEDITSIDEANRLIYSQYERELTDLGIDYHIIKDLYNDNSKATLRDKRNALMQVIKAIKKE